jgi:hypothetical protein
MPRICEGNRFNFFWLRRDRLYLNHFNRWRLRGAPGASWGPVRARISSVPMGGACEGFAIIPSGLRMTWPEDGGNAVDVMWL